MTTDTAVNSATQTNPATATTATTATAANAGTATSAAAVDAPQAQTSSPSLSQEMMDWGMTKGFQNADLQKMAADPQAYKMLTSYREAERMLGSFQSGDKLIIPKEPGDKAAWDSVYARLGRPETADQYKMEIPQGADGNFALEAGKWFHEAGLNQAQAETLNKHWNGYVAGFVEQQNKALAEQAATEVTNLEKEWGANLKLNSELATRGLNVIGKELALTGDRIEAIRNGDNVTLSAAEALKLFRLVGDIGKTTGDTFEGSGPGQRGTGLSMTPEAAKVRLNTLQNDPAFYKRLMNNDAEAVKERDGLLKTIAGTRVV